MCIRDRCNPVLNFVLADTAGNIGYQLAGKTPIRHESYGICLLYTSDAADERSSVDLGGRRIIKKKKQATRHESAQ